MTSAALSESSRYSGKDSALYLAASAVSLAVLSVAWRLAPAASGLGTHQQLGLPACTFFRVTGWPCPSCGMTTSFAHAAKLQFAQAIADQPFGFLVFLTTLALAPAAAVLMARRIPLARLFDPDRTLRGVYIYLTLYFLGWCYKLAVFASAARS